MKESKRCLAEMSYFVLCNRSQQRLVVAEKTSKILDPLHHFSKSKTDTLSRLSADTRTETVKSAVDNFWDPKQNAIPLKEKRNKSTEHA